MRPDQAEDEKLRTPADARDHYQVDTAPEQWRSQYLVARIQRDKTLRENAEIRAIIYEVATGGYTPMQAHEWLESHPENGTNFARADSGTRCPICLWALYDGDWCQGPKWCANHAKSVDHPIRLTNAEAIDMIRAIECALTATQAILREAADSVHASLAEMDISDSRREYREGLEHRLRSMANESSAGTDASGKTL